MKTEPFRPFTRPSFTTQSPSTSVQNRLLLLLQIPVTLAIIVWMSGNKYQVAVLIALWSLTFGRVTKREAIFYVAACLFFTGMNALSLKQGIFTFSQPYVLGMPIYELFMWGFYLLHTWRLIGGPAPLATKAQRWQAWGLALLYAAAFGSIPDANTLLAVTAALLLVGLVLFHAPHDLAYVGYMVLLGAAVEYTGVWSGEWFYPGDPPGGVPLWFVTLWGGVGLFMRRLIVPLLQPAKQPTRD